MITDPHIILNEDLFYCAANRANFSESYFRALVKLLSSMNLQQLSLLNDVSEQRLPSEGGEESDAWCCEYFTITESSSKEAVLQQPVHRVFRVFFQWSPAETMKDLLLPNWTTKINCSRCRQKLKNKSWLMKKIRKMATSELVCLDCACLAMIWTWKILPKELSSWCTSHMLCRTGSVFLVPLVCIGTFETGNTSCQCVLPFHMMLMC